MRHVSLCLIVGVLSLPALARGQCGTASYYHQQTISYQSAPQLTYAAAPTPAPCACIPSVPASAPMTYASYQQPYQQSDTVDVAALLTLLRSYQTTSYQQTAAIPYVPSYQASYSVAAAPAYLPSYRTSYAREVFPIHRTMTSGETLSPSGTVRGITRAATPSPSPSRSHPGRSWCRSRAALANRSHRNRPASSATCGGGRRPVRVRAVCWGQPKG
jgi:hypothetical protein